MKLVFQCLLSSILALALTGNALAIDLTLGTWLEEDVENLSTVTGSGNTFTATPGPSVNATNTSPARQRVYQQFSSSQKADFSSSGQKVSISFDIVFNGVVEANDSDFRFSLIDTSTNQGFYPVSWDLGGRAGTYVRSRFVDNLDGDPDDGFDPWGNTYVSSLSGSGTIAQSSAAPTISGAGVEQGLVDGNTVHFEAVLTRNAGDSFSFDVDATEDSGLVVYPTVSGTYNPVNPTSGDTSTSMQALNQFDGIVFGINDNLPFTRVGDFDTDGDIDGADFLEWQGTFDTLGAAGLAEFQSNYGTDPSESYTVSNLVISADALVSVPLVAAVPEPSTLALLAMTSLALLSSRKKS